MGFLSDLGTEKKSLIAAPLVWSVCPGRGVGRGKGDLGQEVQPPHSASYKILDLPVCQYSSCCPPWSSCFLSPSPSGCLSLLGSVSH